jgi:trimeric autotransporter adhesin
VGHNAGNAVTTGQNNTAIGGQAGIITTGTNNTALGIYTMGFAATTGDQNTAVGYAALYEITSGSNNTALGRDAGRATSPSGSITTGTDNIVLGDNNVTNAYIKVAWTVTSDARDKTDFTPLDLGLDFVKELKPITYKWDMRSKYGDSTAADYDVNAQTPDGTHKEDWLDIGFKAQDVEALEVAAGYTRENKTNLVSSLTEDGKQMGLKYEKFVPILVKAIQELSEQNAALTARIEALES